MEAEPFDPSEIGWLHARMRANAIGYEAPLHREVVVECFATPVAPGELVSKAMKAGPEKVRATLRAKLTGGEYQSYLGSVFTETMAMAEASGRKFSKSLARVKASGGASSRRSDSLTAAAAFFAVGDSRAAPRRVRPSTGSAGRIGSIGPGAGMPRRPLRVPSDQRLMWSIGWGCR
ncbi:MAG: hypothetical protein ABIJ48_05795 [Actinomycetota bacterium]